MEKKSSHRMAPASSVTVHVVSPEDRADLCALRVADEQTRFVASNADSLEEADENDACVPLVIRAGGQPVGFAMHALDEDDGNRWLYRLMIDARFQGHGYGAAALSLIVRRLSALPDCPFIMLGVKPENEAAIRLYERAGFRPTGETIEGEMVMRLGV